MYAYFETKISTSYFFIHTCNLLPDDVIKSGKLKYTYASSFKILKYIYVNVNPFPEHNPYLAWQFKHVCQHLLTLGWVVIWAPSDISLFSIFYNKQTTKCVNL